MFPQKLIKNPIDEIHVIFKLVTKAKNFSKAFILSILVNP